MAQENGNGFHIPYAAQFRSNLVSGASTLTEQEPTSSGSAEASLPAQLVLNNKWEILGHIATGGKGEIYRAHQLSLERVVALKVISPDFVDSFKDNPEELESEKERFRREVRVMAGIRHPNVLQVFDYDTAIIGDAPIEYLVMEYIPGSTLRSTMPKEGFGPDRQKAIDWLKAYYLPVLEGVAAIHDAGIIHRDIKPENILLDGPVPKIADFGLARILQQPGLTNTFHILGTIFYMPKQQFEDGGMVDAKADIYALGKVLYEAVTGKITNASKVVFKEVGLKPEVNEGYADVFFVGLDAVIRNATREEAEGRTASAGAMAETLRALVASYDANAAPGRLPDRERFMRRLYGSLIVLVAVLIAVVSFHFSQEKGSRNPGEVNATAGQSSVQPGTADEKFIQTEDGAKLRLMPSGTQRWLPVRGGAEEVTELVPFYVEETLVSNSRYVAFLNAVKNDISVKDSAVSMQGAVIYLLGETREGYEPIVYENGTFRVNGPTAGNDPVVRVSAEGALAFAIHYGRELPGTAQWLTAKQLGIVSAGGAPRINEWGMDMVNTKTQFYVFESSGENQDVFCPLPRQKWEASEHVGFRTVLPYSRRSGV